MSAGEELLFRLDTGRIKRMSLPVLLSPNGAFCSVNYRIVLSNGDALREAFALPRFFKWLLCWLRPDLNRIKVLRCLHSRNALDWVYPAGSPWTERIEAGTLTLPLALLNFKIKMSSGSRI